MVEIKLVIAKKLCKGFYKAIQVDPLHVHYSAPSSLKYFIKNDLYLNFVLYCQKSLHLMGFAYVDDYEIFKVWN